VSSNPGKIFVLLDDESEAKIIVRQIWRLSQDSRESKSIKKSAKRALYVLKSGGINIDRYKPVLKKKKVVPAEDQLIVSTLLSIPDSEGNSQLVIPVSDAQGLSLKIYWFLINMEKGILQFSSIGGSKKLIERLKNDNQDFFPVSPEYAVFRLNSVLRKTDAGKVSGLNALPAVLLDKEEKEVEHPVISLVPVSISRILSPDEEKKIFTMREVGALMLPEEDERELKAKIEEAGRSKLIIGNKTPEERTEETLDHFYSTYFTPQKLAFYRGLLLDVALSCYYRKLTRYARILVEYANRLVSPRLVPRDHPFLNFLVYRAIMPE